MTPAGTGRPGGAIGGFRLGLLGGAFNPVHRGHLALAAAARTALRLDQVWLIPTGQPGHRQSDLAAAHHRLAMCKLAARGRPWLEVSDLETARPGVSYTVDTLQAVRRSAPGAVLYLLVGADAAVGLQEWRDSPRVLELARVCVLSRPGASLKGVDPELLRHLLILPALTPPISASEVRQRRRQGLPVHRLLPRGVAAYCDRHRLYLA